MRSGLRTADLTRRVATHLTRRADWTRDLRDAITDMLLLHDAQYAHLSLYLQAQRILPRPLMEGKADGWYAE